MTKEHFIQHLQQQYGATADYPWQRFPDYAVFRHQNGKWFAVLMNVLASKLGLAGDEMIDIVNVKLPPEQIAMLDLIGIGLPAYPMNKTHWRSLPLAGDIDDETLLDWVLQSYRLILPKRKGR